MATSMKNGKYGVLLPHFGPHAKWDTVLTAATKAEAYGFDSVWVRDHLIFHPHGMEGTDPTFLEPFTVLTAIAALTKKVELGFGSIIPHRHPIYASQQLNAMDTLAGGRTILGFGAGAFEHEFEAIGMGGINRTELLQEQVEVIRKVTAGGDVEHNGKQYQFKDVSLKPAAPRPIPVWYCGATPASARLAVDFCDGWMPGRINYPTYEKRIANMTELSKEKGRKLPTIGAIPITSPGKNKDEAAGKVNLKGLLSNANGQRFWVKPESGEFKTAEDLAGSFIYGSADDIVASVRRYHEIGNDHLVFDLRFRFDEYMDCLRVLGEEVLPKLRAG